MHELYSLCKNPPSPDVWARFWTKVQTGSWQHMLLIFGTKIRQHSRQSALKTGRLIDCDTVYKSYDAPIVQNQRARPCLQKPKENPVFKAHQEEAAYSFQAASIA